MRRELRKWRKEEGDGAGYRGIKKEYKSVTGRKRSRGRDGKRRQRRQKQKDKWLTVRSRWLTVSGRWLTGKRGDGEGLTGK